VKAEIFTIVVSRLGEKNANSPNGFAAVCLEGLIRTDDGQIMHEALGCDEPVKRVVVDRRQFGRAIEGFPDEIKDFNVLQPDLLFNPVARRLGQR